MKLLEHLRVTRSLPVEERRYCPLCGVLVVKDEGCGAAQAAADLSHAGHGVIEGITDTQLDNPTTLLNPMDDRKAQAVHFFV